MPSYTASGSLSRGGLADFTTILNHGASGGLSLSGSAVAVSSYYSYSASGSLGLGNSSPVSSTQWFYASSGGLRASDSAICYESFSLPSGGNVNFSGSTEYKLIFEFAASGGLAASGTAKAVIKPILGFAFTWDVSEGVLKTWRVEGKCRPAGQKCPPIYNTSPGCPSENSTMQMVVNVQAHSVTDLCDKLKQKGSLGPIKRIQVWSLPANRSDWGENDSADCNTLSDVDFSDVPNCVDFTVDQDLSVSAKVSAGVIITSDYEYSCSGSLSSGGSASAPVSSYYAYPASGRLGVSGISLVSSSKYFHHEASGGLSCYGTADSHSSEYGTLEVSAAFGMTVSDLGVVFGTEDAGILTAGTDLISTSCCDLSLPQILFLRHEFSRSDPISNFLFVNGQTLPPVVSLMYNRNRKTWYYSQQFRGSSVSNDADEVWGVLFEFGCSAENAILGVPPDAWNFSSTIRRSSGSRTDITRLLLTFDPLDVCDISGALNFAFSFDKQSSVVDPAVVRTVVFQDQIGSFGGKAYTIDPAISFEISTSVPATGVGMFDQSVVFQNMLLGV